MAIGYYKPHYTDPMRRSFELLNTLANTLERGTAEADNVAAFVPTVNTRVDNDAYTIEIDLPGIKKNEVEITTEDNVLTVSGERKFQDEVAADDYYKVESRYGKFVRSFTLPEDADIEKIDAQVEDGVLEITIPKRADIQKVKKITIK